jgi:spore coat protein U-like protein
MKRSLHLIALAALTFAGPAMAQSSATATASANATATVLTPISLSKATDLAFGAMVRPGSGANTIAIDATTGNRTLTGSGNASLAASAPTRATFSVGGEGAQAFSITVPSPVNITRSGGTETVPVTLNASAAAGLLSGSAGNTGSATFGVGGSLPLDTTVVGGSYTGTFNVTVGYN